MPTFRFKQVDVFTSRPLYGNPVAVVLGADGLSTDEMQRFAAWTNLSETTFVLTPTIAGPAYRLRIFTPSHELPFAGHPTVGSCHAVLEAGIVSEETYVQQGLYWEVLYHPLIRYIIKHYRPDLAMIGYPITDEFQEGDLTVQYFERGRFEWHPGAWPERYDVLLGRLAAEALSREIDQ